MNKNMLFGALIVVIIIGGTIFFVSQSHQQEQNTNSASRETSGTEGKTVTGYNGKVLAGSKSPYLIFNKTDYQKALSSGKIIFLDFYANWCPICRAEAPELKAGFNSLTTDKVVGFRVNWNDSDTTDDDKQMSSQFGITSQHTKVILKDGKEIARTLEQWDKTTFLQTMNEAINK